MRTGQCRSISQEAGMLTYAEKRSLLIFKGCEAEQTNLYLNALALSVKTVRCTNTPPKNHSVTGAPRPIVPAIVSAAAPAPLVLRSAARGRAVGSGGNHPSITDLANHWPMSDLFLAFGKWPLAISHWPTFGRWLATFWPLAKRKWPVIGQCLAEICAVDGNATRSITEQITTWQI